MLLKNGYIFFLLLIANCSVAQDSLLHLANEAFSEQKYIEASKLYDDAYNVDTLNLKLKLKSAYTLHLAGRSKEAKAMINNLLVNKRDSVDCYAILGKIYEYEVHPLGIKTYNYLINKDSNNLTYRKGLAKILDHYKHYSEALKVYLHIDEKLPNDFANLQSLAQCYVNLTDDSLANVYVEKAMNIDSNRTSIKFLKARIDYNQKRYSSVPLLLEPLKNTSEFTPYYFNLLGLSYMNLDSFEKAKYNFTHAMSDEIYKEFAHYYIGTMEEKQGLKMRASLSYHNAIKSGISKYIDLYYKKLGDLNLEMDDYDAAIKDYTQAIFYEDKPEYHYNLAQTYDLKQDNKQALTKYKEYIEKTNENAKYYKVAKSRIADLENLLSTTTKK